ncbi:NlpC/P60 family protein [Streptomyces klenkii]|uniref:NlpC/P60 family protein n=1 Tax=Streptomyces klenkii TaxID=1420899 RepID=A0A3B0AV66_9ACTN|nr:NlpC/P60 family protein [Streptomyces klenkii]
MPEYWQDAGPGGPGKGAAGVVRIRGAVVAAVWAAVLAGPGAGPAAAAPSAAGGPPAGRGGPRTVLPAARPVGDRLEPAIRYALAHVGDPFAMGGDGPRRWDCSGLVQQAYRRAGVRLPRVAADQYRATKRIGRRALRRGDLVFWSRNGRASGVHHVAVYLGGERYVEAPRPGSGVRVSTFGRYRPNAYGRVG